MSVCVCVCVGVREHVVVGMCMRAFRRDLRPSGLRGPRVWLELLTSLRVFCVITAGFGCCSRIAFSYSRLVKLPRRWTPKPPVVEKVSKLFPP